MRCHHHPQSFGSNRHSSTHIHIRGLVHPSHVAVAAAPRTFGITATVAVGIKATVAVAVAATCLETYPGDHTSAVATWAAARGAAIECKDGHQAMLIN